MGEARCQLLDLRNVVVQLVALHRVVGRGHHGTTAGNERRLQCGQTIGVAHQLRATHRVVGKAGEFLCPIDVLVHLLLHRVAEVARLLCVALLARRRIPAAR